MSSSDSLARSTQTHPLSAGPVRARGQAKVAAILQAAGRLFRQHGFASTSMDAVADAAAVSKATVYAYYRSKQELFAAVIQLEGDRDAAGSIDAVIGSAPIQSQLRELGHSVLSLLLSEATVTSYRMTMAEAARQPELGRLYYENGPQRLLQRLEHTLEAAMHAGRLRRADPQRAAQQFVGLVRGDLMLRALLCVDAAPDEASIASAVRDGVDTFLRAYRP